MRSPPLVSGLALAGALLLAGCAAPGMPDAPGGPGAAGPPPLLRLLVLGDPGTGSEDQHRVAAAALAVCAARGCDAAVVAGDNIYECGVTSPQDPQFDAKFEEPYRGFAMPFYMVLGNHDNGAAPADCGGGMSTQNGDHQVAYARRADRASDKWNMPARYYDVRLGDVHLFGLDTTPLWWGADALSSAGPDPLGLQQQAWIDGALAASDAPWKVVLGHHPYVSNGQHGDAGTEGPFPVAGPALKRFFEESVCGQAHLLLAGHDHDLQWLKPVPACGPTHFLVSGAAAKQRPLADEARHAAWFQKGDTLGFAWLAFHPGTYTAAFYDGAGAPLFEQELPRP